MGLNITFTYNYRKPLIYRTEKPESSLSEQLQHRVHLELHVLRPEAVVSVTLGEQQHPPPRGTRVSVSTR